MTTRVPLLLHSLAELAEVLLPILTVAGIRSVTEVGAETGVTTRVLLDYIASQGGGRVVSVDPFAERYPTGEIPAGVLLEQVFAFSPDCLNDLEPTDCYSLDGDHNWWTVKEELTVIEASAAGAPHPLVLFNDVSWPCARRDQYYNPDRLPAEVVHPYSWGDGVEPGNSGIVLAGGFRGAGEFAVARQEGGPRNGVLTAIEDHIDGRSDLVFLLIPHVFGLGVLIDRRHSWADEVAAIAAPHVGELAHRLEANRMDLYTRVIALQDNLQREVGERRSLLAEIERLRERLTLNALPPAAMRRRL